MERCSSRRALELATAMAGMFKPDRETDERAFLPIFAKLFELYPESVALAVANPITGLPSKLKFFPSIAEVRAACEEAFAPQRQWLERDEARQDHYRRFPLLSGPPLQPLTPEDRERLVALWEQSRHFGTSDPEEIERQHKIREVEADAKLLTLRGQPMPKMGLGIVRALVARGEDFSIPDDHEAALLQEGRP